MSTPTPTLAKAALISFGVSALLLPAQGVTTFTSPSGYTKLVATKAPSTSVPAYSFISHSLAQKRKVGGVITGGGASSLTSTGAGWGVNEFSTTPHYVLMGDGAKEGTMFEIVSNTADTLTLASGDLSGNVNDSFRIYEHNTLGSIFGADPVANGVVGGFGPATADQILLYDTASGGFKTYFYKNLDDFGDEEDVLGWVNASNNHVEVSSLVIAANRGFVYVRRDHTADLSITVFGDVIDSSINVAIIPGFNLVPVPTPVATGVTLGNSGLAPTNPTDPIDPSIHLKAGFGAATADTIFIWNGSGYDTFFFKNVDDFGDEDDVLGWVNASNNHTAVPDTSLEPGSFFISRSANPALDWVFPSIVP
ncbi:MAG: hypothetical protein O3A87_11725 [Verrucomicrobia bacterium]|nr:hypothetical protein [Verrucomicrobiota bacterium]MDA1007132.1 hypothetical protein [Verrucomicrobiota bacterium]